MKSTFKKFKETKRKVRYEEEGDKPMTGGAIYFNQGFLVRQFGAFPPILEVEVTDVTPTTGAPEAEEEDGEMSQAS
jgi:hypothetical protein